MGAGNAALELIQLDELTDAYKITKKTGVTQNVAKAIADEIVRRMGNVAIETGQEVGQEAATITGVQIGSKLDTGKWAYNSRTVMDRLNDTAKSSMLTFGLLDIPADVVSMRQQLMDMQHKQKVDALMAAYEKNVGPVEVGTKLDEPVAAGYDSHGKTSEEYLPETEPSTELGSESTTDLKANRIPDNDSVIGHIFRTAGGHIPDTPENRVLLEDVANHAENLRGIDMYRNEWYVKILEDGRQVWAEARNGNIFEGGINDMPNPWDPATGLKKSRKESGT